MSSLRIFRRRPTRRRHAAGDRHRRHHVAPWQFFFQQSYVIDKRIRPRFIRYERIDLGIGIVLVAIGAVAMMAFSRGGFRRHGRNSAISRMPAASPRAPRVCRPGRRRALRHRPYRREPHRRGGGVALHRLRHRRFLFDAALAEPQPTPGQIFLRAISPWSGRRRFGADPGLPLGPADQCRADAGRRVAAERHGVSAAALQRQAVLGPWVNSRAAEFVHRRRHRRPASCCRLF